MKSNTLSESNTGLIALLLRVGLGVVFIIGGTSKLSLLLSESTNKGMVDNYMSTSGYINELFQQFLFTGMLGNLLSPGGFLTALSTFELVSGIALVAGLFVRPLSLFYAFLLWTFVIALPTMTVPGVDIGVKTYTSPAIFVQIRDIALSGFMFVLFNAGTGIKSIDGRYTQTHASMDWNTMGLLLRSSLAIVMIVGGFFGEFAKIATFSTPQLLLAVSGLALIFGSKRVIQSAGFLVVGIMIWYIFQKFSLDKTLIKNLNGVKREFALLAAGLVLGLFGGGDRFTAVDILERTKNYISNYFRPRLI
ncbi:DoxX family membrane protein [Motiliproteus sp. MSK22-1]|uniref:DoxX family membrane protein n=1 Tax=Motiliproteus sp. MSK22-1 TaxID=1897630 RepID=UPI0009765479|nr:DoxX family membrane protein [Motiliproteus sp. MSK22-1]OMH39685.1 hypothetical protein BGP75_02290 [Motiliproteus sp. MSK22-1]